MKAKKYILFLKKRDINIVHKNKQGVPYILNNKDTTNK